MLDFSTIKQITIPEGTVKKIEINNDIVWRRELPEGYTRLDYISFNNNKCFDLQFIPDLNTKIICTFKRSTTGSFYLYGVTNSNNTKSVTAYLSSTGNWRFGNKYKGIASISTNTKYHSIQDKTNLIVEDVLEYTYSSQNYFKCLGNLFLGGNNTNGAGTPGSAKLKGIVYEFQIYQDDVFACNLIPSKDPNNVEGFYDNIRDLFLTSII